jgi:hypothetical protein
VDTTEHGLAQIARSDLRSHQMVGDNFSVLMDIGGCKRTEFHVKISN